MLVLAVAAAGLVPMVSDHVSRSLLTLDSEDSLGYAARLMKHARITGAPVYDDNSIDGILSRNDLLRTIATETSDAAHGLDEQLDDIRLREVWRVMTSRPPTVSPDASMVEAANIMAETKLNRLMVKAKYGAVLGILTSTDVVFAMLGCGGPEGCIVGDGAGGEEEPEPIDWSRHFYEHEEVEVLRGSVGESMARRLVVVSPDMCLEDAARVLKEGRVTGAPVMDGEKLVGVLSRNSLLKALATLPDDAAAFVPAVEAMRHQPVSTVMNDQPKTISPSTSMVEAAKIMAAEKLNRLLVTSGPGRLCGIASSTDAVFVLLGACAEGDDECVDFEDDFDMDEVWQERLGGPLGHMGTMY